jgi:hypothetical protein
MEFVETKRKLYVSEIPDFSPLSLLAVPGKVKPFCGEETHSYASSVHRSLCWS